MHTLLYFARLRLISFLVEDDQCHTEILQKNDTDLGTYNALYIYELKNWSCDVGVHHILASHCVDRICSRMLSFCGTRSFIIIIIIIIIIIWMSLVTGLFCLVLLLNQR